MTLAFEFLISVFLTVKFWVLKDINNDIFWLSR